MHTKTTLRLLTLGTTLFAGIACADPLKVALVETLSGPSAATGQMFRAATRFQIERLNAEGGWNGEPIQLLEFDSQGTPAGASEKLKAAIGSGAQMIVQGASSVAAGQITEDVRKYNLRNKGKEVVFLNVGGEALELTGSKCHFYHFRFNGNAPIRVKTLVAAMKEAGTLGSKVYSMNQNYSWGLDMEQAITENAAAGGYQLVGKSLHDTQKVQDFSPYIARIQASGAETVLTGNWGNDLLLLMKASRAAGLKLRFGTAFLDQPGNLANAGDVALGHYVSHPFNIEAAGEAGKTFASEYQAKTGHLPAYIEPQTVFALQMVGNVLKKLPAEDGRLNTRSFALALEKASDSNPLGDVRMRAEDHQLLMPFVVSVVSKEAPYKVDGTDMGFVPIKSFSADQAAAPVQDACRMQRPE
ncbi:MULTISPECIES: branched-chain amino acid ABC transporter substrate-binding protein [unclassified Pseudomonas]|jgi:branched-chain amino acid transport system substrate-binding protein|uniref:branched-chain amino acid ABC transporter substrate-binding protein n=1 Tax=unclassified Pseudomonas TaxID=196821 RepID=UPI000BA431D0|nr:branched-chain amino acid ABC transporter substrate-binding protein [Pseudomonas sp. Irchel 3H3]